jgi:dienelactone hydrolase
MKHLHRCVAMLAMLAVLPLQSSEARPKFPPDETLSIPSLTLTDEQFLSGDSSGGTPVTLTGQLRFPSWDEHLPVVVLLHGSGGPEGGPAPYWRDFLNGMGIATLRLDSFTGRGVENVAENQSQLGWFAQMVDMYRAVDVLAAHPKIDPARIAVMGFSRGGTSVLYGSLQRFRKPYGPTKAKISAFIPFYPRCNLQLVDELGLGDALVREFHGTADNGTSPGPVATILRVSVPPGVMP